MTGNVERRLKSDGAMLVKLYEAGASLDDLSIRCNCSKTTIRRFLVIQGVTLRPAPKNKLDAVGASVLSAFEAGERIEDIARQFQVLPQTVRRYLYKHCDLLKDVGRY